MGIKHDYTPLAAPQLLAVSAGLKEIAAIHEMIAGELPLGAVIEAKAMKSHVEGLLNITRFLTAVFDAAKTSCVLKPLEQIAGAIARVEQRNERLQKAIEAAFIEYGQNGKA